VTTGLVTSGGEGGLSLAKSPEFSTLPTLEAVCRAI
jgi:hypothetical protein